MADKQTIATYDAKAADYFRITATDEPDKTLQAFIDLIPKGARVLDLGCGPATASAHMRAAGLVPDPVDAAQGMVDMANKLHDIGARLATFDDISGAAIYDGVWANFSLLHAPRNALPDHLTAICRTLRPGGVFHIGMKTGSGGGRDALDRLYTYVTTDELHNLITGVGLDIIHTQTGKERGMAGTLDPFVIMRARKNANA